MRIVFMGTPQIAADCLQALLSAGHEVCGVFTREDKPVGRKQVLTPPPVKVLAQQHGIPVYQPKTLRDGEAQKQIAALNPQLIAVVAYGRILPPEILSLPPLGCINLHVSLLPRYRGAAPIQWAVINGDKQTGVTVMQMDEGLDTGDILQVTPLDILPDETAGELFERVSQIGGKTLVQTVKMLQRGEITPMPQQHEQATQAPPLQKDTGSFTFAQSAAVLHNLVRGCNPWPTAYFMLNGKKIKVARSGLAQGNAPAGTVLQTQPLTVACAEGALQLLEVIPEGSRPMTGQAFAAGKRLKSGDVLGEN